MILTFILSILAPTVIYFGLEIADNIYLTFILFHGVVCTVIPCIDLWLFKKYSIKKGLKLLGFKNFKKTWLKGLVLGFIFFLSIYLFFSLLNKYLLEKSQIDLLMKEWGFNKNSVFILLSIMIFANSILEEIYWRGYIFYRCHLKMKINNVLLFTAFFYSSYHFITTHNLFSILYGIIFTGVIFLTGLFWGYVRDKYKSIYVPLISHLLADLAIMVIYVQYIY